MAPISRASAWRRQERAPAPPAGPAAATARNPATDPVLTSASTGNDGRRGAFPRETGSTLAALTPPENQKLS
jgi:hypothetical protein